MIIISDFSFITIFKNHFFEISLDLFLLYDYIIFMKFYGELLIFVLLFITNFRVFFAKKPRRDPLTVVAPFTFLLSILQIIAWGVELLTVLGFVIAFLVLISNFHALFRYSEQLYIDRYSPLMKFWALMGVGIGVNHRIKKALKQS